MIGETQILPADVIEHLAALPSMPRVQAFKLLDPRDKQNVPKAVTLIQSLAKLNELEMPADPVAYKKCKVILFFGDLLGDFVRPFIKIDTGLSEQIRSLSAFAHLSAALQILHGTACLTGALYADTQAVVKNLVFTVAQMKVIDPKLAFYIIIEGSDQLEGSFGSTRTQDHSQNFDVEQLAGKLSVAALIDTAFERNLECDCGHHCLTPKDAMGIDHINVKSWDGPVCVGDVDLEAEWKAGRLIANHRLKVYLNDSQGFNFDRLFLMPNHDLLRPLGEYVGIKTTSDDLQSEDSEENAEPLISRIEPGLAPSVDLPEADVSLSTELESEQRSLENDIPDDSTAFGMDIDDFMPNTLGGLEQKDKPVAFTKTLIYEGKTYLKSSVVASLCSNRSQKVSIHTLCVRGVALEDLCCP
ncbi:hypothetical protein HWV62_38482 [Athelia sp. TMB]|nr:hypothetical protein HWV62_38482 [Athelia sp. TMB]